MVMGGTDAATGGWFTGVMVNVTVDSFEVSVPSLAVNTNGSSYRLEGIDSQFSPFVNARVEVSGEVKPSGEKTGAPTLLVEFVQKTAATCQ